MSTKKYKGPLETIEHAMMAHLVVTITCETCLRWRGMYAWKIWNSKPWARQLPLGKAITGFWCKGCHKPVLVVITLGMR